jgi:alcohol dehydrogenase (cytochrome c)
VQDGIVYVSSGGYSGNYAIYALNESTGAILWNDSSGGQMGQTISTTRGVALADRQIFAGTQNNGLISPNARTGALNWKVPIAEGIVGNPTGFYIGPLAIPVVLDHVVVIANTEGDSGSRGYIRGFNESNGNLLWTFYTVPPSPITSGDQGFYQDTWGACAQCGGGAI